MIDDVNSSNILRGTRMEDKIKAMNDSIKEISTILRQQSSVFPKFAFKDGQASNITKNIKEIMDPFLEANLQVNNMIMEFSLSNTGSIDSKIIKSFTDVTKIKTWISKGPVQFKLLYRGTRDGFKSVEFQKKCGTIKPTITLIKSNYDKIFGGFTDQDWSNTSNYKQTDNAFIFSVSNNKKYTLIKGHKKHSSYACANYLPTFGGGFDIYCCENGDQTNTNYSNFPYSYEANGDTKEGLTGAYNFTLKEVEVFHVITAGDSVREKVKPKEKSKKVQKQVEVQNLEVEEDFPDDGFGLFGD